MAQNAFLTALQHLQELRDDERFGPWLVQITTRLAYRLLEERKREPTQSLEALATGGGNGEEDVIPRPEFIADWKESPEALLERADTYRLVEQALSELPDKYRIIFLLRDVEGLSTKETAESLGISEANVKVRLLRARLQLREKLTRLFGDETKKREPHRHGGLTPETGDVR